MALVGAISSGILRNDPSIRISARRLLTDPASEQREVDLANRQFTLAQTRLTNALDKARSAKQFRQANGVKQL